MAAHATAKDENIFDRLAALPSEASRLQFLSRHRLLSRTIVEQLDEAVRVLVRVDLKKAQSLAETAVAAANQLDDDESRAYATRAKANAWAFLGRNREASDLYIQAVELFRLAEKPVEAGRTLSSSIQSLILLGEYDQAQAAAEEAGKIFSEAGETVRLARLDINVGNIFHRQDMFREALDCYRRAHSRLVRDGDQEGIIASLHNIAVCLIMLNDYEAALSAYEELREFSSGRNVPLAMAQAEYNIAYLHYLRGAYGRALEMLRTAREFSQKAGDAYHSALCGLDLSEIYLELNLHRDAVELANRARSDFQRLGMGYEGAKALCLSAIALSRQHKAFRAIELFEQARAMFIKEKNRVWPSLIDLYEAFTYFNEGNLLKAREHCLAALSFFGSSPLPGRAILCRLLLARLSLRTGEVEEARRECEIALHELTGKETPILLYQARLVMGQIEEACNKLEKAENHYRTAKKVLETLRTGLHAEELKISFMENRLEVYEHLVDLCLAPGLPAKAKREAWTCIEQAKSRGLLELIVRREDPAASSGSAQPEMTVRILNLREQLNWYYHRIEVEQLAQEPAGDDRLRELQSLAEQCEREFLRLLRDLPSEEAEAAGLEALKPVSFETIREALAPGATLVEYFRIRDRMVAAIVSEDGFDVVPVASASRVAELLRMLQFQLAKFHLGPEYVQRFDEPLLKATQSHLGELYRELLAPVRDALKGRHLIVVPHEVLHQVPFHALFDGKNYLIDSFSVSYAPSGSIYMQCRERQANKTGSSLILGVPDSHRPAIDQEIHSIAGILPQTELFLGRNASQQVLREKGPQSRLIHIATHGVFRQDNPMFSGVQLGDSFLTLYDLYQLKLPVEQITLSGCSTGLNAIGAGDELIGLMRGLLFAGARSLLLTLWDVNDGSTADFMQSFYRRFFKYGDRGLALQSAMQELRERYPHPYYWAPFILVGNVFP